MTNIPDWIIKYDEANYQSSAGRAIRELIKIINELENSSNSNNKPLVKGAVSGRSEQLPQLCQCTIKHEDCECAFYNECSECGLPLR